MRKSTPTDWAWQQDLPHTQKLVLLALAHDQHVTLALLTEKCGCSRSTAIRAIHELESRRLITVERREQQPNLYMLPKLAGCHGDTTPCQNDTTPCQNDTPPEPPKKTVSRKETALLAQQAEAIYAAYPRKVGKPAALKAINATIKLESLKQDLGLSYQQLLEKTRLYARARAQAISKNHEESKFTPHPATWFNQQRYMDDPIEWGINPAADARNAQRAKGQQARDARYHKEIADLVNSI
jgi:hypothetical protein